MNCSPRRVAGLSNSWRRIFGRSDILTHKAFENAFALDVAMGGSTNTVLHTLAIAIEAGQPFDLAHLNEVSARVPYICKVAPSGKYHMEDVYRAGGISAILKTLAGKPGTLNLDCITVTGKTLGREHWRRDRAR